MCLSVLSVCLPLSISQGMYRDRPLHKSGNVQGQTITQVKECSGTDNSTGEKNFQRIGTDHYTSQGMYRDRPLHKSGNVQGQTITQVKECTGTDNSTGERNVQGQTISKGKRIFKE